MNLKFIMAFSWRRHWPLSFARTCSFRAPVHGSIVNSRFCGRPGKQNAIARTLEAKRETQAGGGKLHFAPIKKNKNDAAPRFARECIPCSTCSSNTCARSLSLVMSPFRKVCSTNMEFLPLHTRSPCTVQMLARRGFVSSR